MRRWVKQPNTCCLYYITRQCQHLSCIYSVTPLPMRWTLAYELCKLYVVAESHLKHVTSEVRHDQGDGEQREVERAVPLQMRAFAVCRLMVHVLRDVCQDSQGNAERDGVRKDLCSLRGCKSKQPRKEQRPASAADESWERDEKRSDGRPYARVWPNSSFVKVVG